PREPTVRRPASQLCRRRRVQPCRTQAKEVAMRVRKSVITAAIVAASAMSWTRAAAAQGAAPATPPGVPAPSLMKPQGTVPPDLLQSTFTPKVVLDAAWTKAIRAVLDEMKHLVLLERAAAAGALPAVADVHYVAPPPAVPAFQPPGWKPLQEIREA